MKPEWCPQEFWELATNLEMDVAVNHGGEFPAPILAKALLEAHQRGRREGMEEAAGQDREAVTREDGSRWTNAYGSGQSREVMNMREKIAMRLVALYEQNDGPLDGLMEADAALDALMEPTEEMIGEGDRVMYGRYGCSFEVAPIYEAMIQAAKDGK